VFVAQGAQRCAVQSRPAPQVLESAQIPLTHWEAIQMLDAP
jgi:hypothetical protein